MRRVIWMMCACMGLAAPDAAAESPPAPKRVELAAADGLEVTADLYLARDDRKTPFIVLFHQAGWSRGEYREIAPKLNALGFNCMAVDQRSGGEVNGVVNDTAARAAKRGKSTSYVDALPDMRAALVYAREHYASGPVLAWGSSYSAALVLKLAGAEPDLVDGVLAFSPGEYFAKAGKSRTWIRSSASAIKVPVFIASAKSERSKWKAIADAIPGDATSVYVPKTAGNHGSRALWAEFDDSAGYWAAVEAFLARFVTR